MSAIAAESQGIGASRTIARLLYGLIRCSRSDLLPWVWLIPMIIRTASGQGVQITSLMAASMGLAFFLGFSSGTVGAREDRILPVTERDLWVTNWLNATLVVPFYVLILKGLGMAAAAAGGKTFFTPETLLLSTIYDFVYAGTLLALSLLLPSLSTAVGKRIDRFSLPVGSPRRKAVGLFIVISSFVVVPLLLLLGAGAPLLFAGYLPTRLADLSTTSALLLLGGLTMSVAALIWTPLRGGERPLFERATPPVQAPPAKPGLGDGLTGVQAVIWIHVRSTFVLAAIGIAAVLAIMPFMPPREFNARFLTGMFLVFSFMGISMDSVWTPWMRRLKVLPLSAKQVTALFVLTPLVTWMEIWLMLLLLHAALKLPIHAELGPLAMLALAGLSSLSHSIRLGLMGSVVGRMVTTMVTLLSIAGTGVLVLQTPGRWTRLLVLAIALASLALAALINHGTLTRSTSSGRAYRSREMSMRP